MFLPWRIARASSIANLTSQLRKAPSQSNALTWRRAASRQFSTAISALSGLPSTRRATKWSKPRYRDARTRKDLRLSAEILPTGIGSCNCSFKLNVASLSRLLAQVGALHIGSCRLAALGNKTPDRTSYSLPRCRRQRYQRENASNEALRGHNSHVAPTSG